MSFECGKQCRKACVLARLTARTSRAAAVKQSRICAIQQNLAGRLHAKAPRFLSVFILDDGYAVNLGRLSPQSRLFPSAGDLARPNEDHKGARTLRCAGE